MIDTFYDNVVIKIKYDGTDGSGVLFQTDDCSFTYLITAWHCLNSKEVVNPTLLSIYRQELGNMKKLDISIQDYLFISENDIVIIKIDYIPNVKLNFAFGIVVGDDVDITGFPIAMAAENSQVKRFPLGASIASIPDADRIVMTSKQPLDTYGKPPKEVVSSCSGSGIFKKMDDQIFLCGIVTDLGETEGALRALNGISVECLKNGLKVKEWEALCDLECCTFNHYKEGTIEIFEDQLKRICSVQMQNVRNNVLPIDIKNKCGKKLVWPYSTTRLHNKNIWEGWLLYLIIRSIENKDNMKAEKFYVLNGTERKVKLIYVRNKTTLSDFLKEYLEDAYADIKNGDYLIIKTDKTPARKILNRSQIDKIVTDVSNVICMKEELYIDDVKSDTRKISMIHIAKMVDDLNVTIDGFDDAIGDRVLEEKLGERIGELLNEI